MTTAALTTLANAKAWCDVNDSTDDALLTRLINQASRMILAHLQRPNLFQQVYSDAYDGTGSGRQMLRNWPVLSVAALTVGTQSIAASAAYGQVGYTLEPWDGLPPGRQQALDLYGCRFWTGLANVAVTYTAGYVVQNETQTVPSSPYQITVNAPYGNWAVDQGVAYASGGALTPVASSPAVGQYVAAAGVYTFNAGDSGKAVLISYSYVPFDVEQACIEIVAERYAYMDRIGMKSKSLGGNETMSYNLNAMPDYILALLRPYKRVTFV